MSLVGVSGPPTSLIRGPSARSAGRSQARSGRRIHAYQTSQVYLTISVRLSNLAQYTSSCEPRFTRARIRERYDLADGDPLTLIDLDGAILLSPKLSVADKLSTEIEYLRTQAGLSLEELLDGLREQRASYHADRIGRR